MTGVIPAPAVFRFTDSKGAPLVNGTLSIYLADGTTLATVYTDATLATTQTNPIVIPASGMVQIWLNPVSTFVYVLKDSTGAIIYTVPGVTPNLAPATPQSVFTGFKNFIVNGNLLVDQRQDPTGTITNFIVDRWGRGFNPTTGRNSYALDNTILTPNANPTIKLVCTTAQVTMGASDAGTMSTWIEGSFAKTLLWGTANAQPFTLQCFIQSNMAAPFNLSISIGNADANVNRRYCRTFLIDSVTQSPNGRIYTFTFPGDTDPHWLATPAVTSAYGDWCVISYGLAAGVNMTAPAGNWVTPSTSGNPSLSGAVGNFYSLVGNQLNIGDVQAERGQVATAFETRSFQEELRLCMRYFQKSYDYLQAQGTVTVDGELHYVLPMTTFVQTVTQYLATMCQFKVPMIRVPFVNGLSPTTGSSNRFHDYTNNSEIAWSNAINGTNGQNNSRGGPTSLPVDSTVNNGVNWVADSDSILI